MSDIIKLLADVQKASRSLNLIHSDQIDALLIDLADAAVVHTAAIIEANMKDLDRMDKNDPKYDRLQLTPKRIQDIAADIRNVAKLTSPLGKVMENKTMPNGLSISKVKVPLGVIGIIYEARPNVTFDVFSLCLKSGNACVLKGGSDAEDSNTTIIKIIKDVIRKHDLNPNIVALLPSDRAATTEMLNATEYVDVIIPRGSQGLIQYVRDNSKVPVIETGAGIVHNYFDESGDIAKAKDIIFNAKTRRVSVCNALDCLLIHRKRLNDLFAIVDNLSSEKVIIYADAEAFEQLAGKYPSELLEKANEDHFGIEFLDYKLSIKTVATIDEAIEHVTNHSSKHSEAIIAEDALKIDHYIKSIDAAVVYANVSTAFTDGAQFGMGAEIGISTQKLHARGPMALDELTSYKWIVRGSGQVRS